MKLALPNRPTAVRRGLRRTARSQGRTAVVVQSMMGNYQYRSRVARLREQGAHLHEFGDRALQQGSYGDDVMALQSYLTEEGYFNSADGLSGYYGAVTREAVQNWQRDQGLRVTGVFNDDCKWAYLRQQEALVSEAAHMGPQVAVQPALWGGTLVSGPQLGAPSTGLLGLAALAAGVGLLFSRRPVKALAVGAGSKLFQGIKWGAQVTAGMLVAASRAVREIPMPSPLDLDGSAADRSAAAKAAERRRRRIAAAAAAAASQPAVDPAAAAAAAAQQQAEWVAAQQMAAAQQEAALAMSAAVPPPTMADELAYLAASAASANAQRPPSPGHPKTSKPRRLSEDELQQRIAVMKGEVPPRTPVPQRPAPRPLPLAPPSKSADDITGSKYGTYYGGRQVREKVKQYLEQDTGIPHLTNLNSPASRRLQSMGYQMNTSQRRPAPAKPASKPAASSPQPQPAAASTPSEPQPAPAAPSSTVEPVAPVQPTVAQLEPFRDVRQPTAAAAEPAVAAAAAVAAAEEAGKGAEPFAEPVAPVVLLSGTELEKAPQKRNPPVPVIKPGMAYYQPAPAQDRAASTAPREAAPLPKPVAVVKPQKRATIGDMLRASRAEEAAEEPPAAALYPVGGGFGFATSPPSTQQQGGRPVNTGSSFQSQSQASCAPGRGSSGGAAAPNRGRSPTVRSNGPSVSAAASNYPVNTGSNFGSSSAEAEEEVGGPPVLYNADGSVVLSSKPIKLVKPAHLLPKTYGFEGMAAEGDSRPPTQASSPPPAEPADYYQHPVSAGSGTDGAGSGSEDVFGSYRRRTY